MPGPDIIEDIDNDFLQSLGGMIYENPGNGPLRVRPSTEHPIQILAKGLIPIDVWYKIYGTK
jgi:hypothetical protein